MTTRSDNSPTPQSTDARRALKWFVVGVLILVLFNVLLFAKFVVSSRESKTAEPGLRK